jgi:hypothetical protein
LSLAEVVTARSVPVTIPGNGGHSMPQIRYADEPEKPDRASRSPRSSIVPPRRSYAGATPSPSAESRSHPTKSGGSDKVPKATCRGISEVIPFPPQECNKLPLFVILQGMISCSSRPFSGDSSQNLRGAFHSISQNQKKEGAFLWSLYADFGAISKDRTSRNMQSCWRSSWSLSLELSGSSDPTPIPCSRMSRVPSSSKQID